MVAQRNYSPEELELLTCADDFEYWVRGYVYIYDPPVNDWIPFDLWNAQVEVAALVEHYPQTLFLKARQLGLTWLVLAIILHGMLFRPIFEALVFSRREDEALYLLGHERLRGMYKKLPPWMQARRLLVDDKSHLRLSNGSGVRAFPSNAGDAYTATFAFIDEADLVPDLKMLLGKVKPTVEAGGKLVLLSRSDKSKPQSHFKQIYRAAKQHLNDWRTMFLPWSVHPDRDELWYERQKRESLENTGSLDELFEQYPATDTEALSARTLDKRIPPAWLSRCYEEMQSIPLELLPQGAPTIPGLKVYRLPSLGCKYVGGVDPAGGLQDGDDSVAVFLDALTGEEVATLVGKFDPVVLAGYVDDVGVFFNNANILVESNNHGWSVLFWLRDYSHLRLLAGFDGKEGWNTTSKAKAILYDGLVEMLREGETLIHGFDAYMQLSGIEGATLRAPEGEQDDIAVAYALACRASFVARYYSGFPIEFV